MFLCLLRFAPVLFLFYSNPEDRNKHCSQNSGRQREDISVVRQCEKEKDAEGNRIYNASLRSQQKPINDIANAFHGGGHRLACGVKGLTKETIEQLLTALLARIKGIQ